MEYYKPNHPHDNDCTVAPVCSPHLRKLDGKNLWKIFPFLVDFVLNKAEEMNGKL